MATRQYIGARYVPKFYQNSVDGSTQWESNVVYDPLIYVTLQNGHMYISKKQVPATVGSPAQNIDYWLDVGSYDGYIDDLQQQINTITGTTIPAINDDIDDLQQQINTITGTTIPAINDDIDDMKDGTVNGSLQYQINRKRPYRLYGKKLGFYCDSYGASYPQWIYRIIDELGSAQNYFNKSYGGYTMSSIYTNLISGDAETADVYVICGGINDWNGQRPLSETGTAINNIINSLLTKSPNCEIYFCLPPSKMSRSGGQTTMLLGISAYRSLIASATKKKCGLLDFNQVNGFKFQSDNIHPTSDTLTKIGDTFVSLLEDYGSNYNAENEIYLTPLGYATINGCDLEICIDTKNFTNGVMEISNTLGTNTFENFACPTWVLDNGGYHGAYTLADSATHTAISMFEPSYTGVYTATGTTYKTLIAKLKLKNSL